jgi:protein-disulfide isomerase
MKKIIFAIFLTYSLSAVCQSTKSSAAKPTPHAATTAKPTPPAAAPAAVTTEEVDSFMKQMFGFQPGVTWKVINIGPAEDPAVTRVVVQVGEQSQVLYVLPGGKFALVGDVIPFGAEPFAPVRSALEAGAHGAVRGSNDAPVTLVEFSDLQCPHCKVAQPVIEKLVAESPNAKLIYQPFPLPMHPWAKQAAAYAECVRQQDPEAMWKFMDSIYDAQADITEANAAQKFSGLVTAAGADAAKASSCAATPDTLAKIQQSIDLGLSVGVSATPTLFIAGRKVLGINNEALPTLKTMIDYEAKQPKK